MLAALVYQTTETKTIYIKLVIGINFKDFLSSSTILPISSTAVKDNNILKIKKYKSTITEKKD